MSNSNHPAIRALLRQHEDGLSINNIASMLDIEPNSVMGALKMMPDVYIDRWQTSRTSRIPFAVWIAVVPPPNCPKPKPEYKRTNARLAKLSSVESRESSQIRNRGLPQDARAARAN
jgi:hypothetical protein